MSEDTLWRYGAEIWIAQPGACLECLRLWRRHALSPHGEPVARTAAIEELAAAHAALRDGFAGPARSLDTRTGETADHHYAAHPDCPRHGDAEPRAVRAEVDRLVEGAAPQTGPLRARRIEDLATDLMPLVDSHLGLVRSIEDHRSHEPMSGASARLRPLGPPGLEEHGYARSGHPKSDRVVALVEALERRAGMRPSFATEIVRGSRNQLGSDAVDPRDFILQDEDPQVTGLSSYSPDTEYEWVWGWSARRRGAVLVPLQLAYFHAGPLTGGKFVYEISNGCAAGSSIGEAAFFGLLEVIERDAFLTSWHSNRPVRRLDSGFVDEWSRGLINRLAAEHVGVEILDIGCGLPGSTLMVEMTNRGRRYLPCLSYAAASHPDPVAAARGALQEVAALLIAVEASERPAREDDARQLLGDPRLVKTMQDHRVQGEAPESLERKRFRRTERADAPPPPHQPGKTAAWLFMDYAEQVLDHAGDVIVVDQRFEPAERRGLCFVKVLAPGLHSMTFGHHRRRLSPERLARFAPPGEWRLDPHMFP